MKGLMSTGKGTSPPRSIARKQLRVLFMKALTIALITVAALGACRPHASSEPTQRGREGPRPRPPAAALVGVERAVFSPDGKRLLTSYFYDLSRPNLPADIKPLKVWDVD